MIRTYENSKTISSAILFIWTLFNFDKYAKYIY